MPDIINLNDFGVCDRCMHTHANCTCPSHLDNAQYVYDKPARRHRDTMSHTQVALLLAGLAFALAAVRWLFF